MKSKKIILMLLMLPILWTTEGCKDYLNLPSEVEISEEKVFGTYNNFQGYIDQMYTSILDHMRTYYTSDGCYAGEAIGAGGSLTSHRAVRGDYMGLIGRGYYCAAPDGGDPGIWRFGWKVIRMSNLGLKNFDHLVASEDEKKWVKGQLLFMRAYFHSEILNAWGPIPYINEALSNDLDKPRFYQYKGKKNFHAVTEYIVEDLTEAATLLPIAWPDPNTQLGKITALAALSYKARALLYAGSPLMNEISGENTIINKEYMERAAVAADEAIKMAENHPEHYGLVDFTDYQRNFATVDKTIPWTKETVLAHHRARFDRFAFSEFIGRTHAVDQATFGGNQNNSTPTQNFVDKFEMADGSLYNPAIHDNDNAKRWAYRDPRFRQNIYIDQDEPIKGASYRLHMYIGGRTITKDGQLTPYVIHKFWPKGVSDKVGGDASNNFCFSDPLMRLAEVYLIYAEAANWAYSTDGNNGDTEVPGANHTALSAVNKVRVRAGHVPTTATGGAHGNFNKMILNERAVEMCFESGQHWHDIRRYKIGESLNNNPIYTLDFDKDYTNFQRRELLKFTFEKRNYWLPFPRLQTVISEKFPQNEGWN